MTDETGERPTSAEKEPTSLEEAVAKLRVLEQENARAIRLIAEGQGAKLDSHGAKLDAVVAKLNKVITALSRRSR